MSRHKHECVECFDPKILDIIKCVCSLEKLVDDVFKCLSCRPSSRRLQQILTCLVLEDVRRIENLLTNETFGLEEIKNEVRQIENTVQTINNNLNTDLSTIVNGVQAVNSSVNSSSFGLRQIQSEIQTLGNNVNNPTFGLRKIENEIQTLGNNVNNPTFGLRQIGNEIRTLSNNVNDSASGMRQIENEIQTLSSNVNDPTFGLRQIGNEIQTLSNNVNDPTFGLREIGNGIQTLGDSINSPTFGLREIGNGIRAVENAVVGIYPRLTTGPVFIDENARHLTVQVQNNTSQPHTVGVRVMRIDKKPFQEIFNKSLEIPAFATNEFKYIDLDSGDCCDNVSGSIEVTLEDLAAGLYPTVAQSNADDKIITSSIFKCADFIPKTEDYA